MLTTRTKRIAAEPLLSLGATKPMKRRRVEIVKNVENISVTDEIQKTHKWCTALNSNCPKEQSESEVDDVLNTSDQNEKDLGNISAEIESLDDDTGMQFEEIEMDD